MRTQKKGPKSLPIFLAMKVLLKLLIEKPQGTMNPELFQFREFLNEVNDLIGIAHLVVVPGHHFHEVIVQ